MEPTSVRLQTCARAIARARAVEDSGNAGGKIAVIAAHASAAHITVHATNSLPTMMHGPIASVAPRLKV
jgi:hypothetical protein